MNLKVIFLILFLFLATLSVVVASDVMLHDDSGVAHASDNDHSGVIHSHHRPNYMNKFSQNHPDYNVLDAIIGVADSGI